MNAVCIIKFEQNTNLNLNIRVGSYQKVTGKKVTGLRLTVPLVVWALTVTKLVPQNRAAFPWSAGIMMAAKDPRQPLACWKKISDQF